MEQIILNTKTLGTLEFPNKVGLLEDFRLLVDNEIIPFELNIFEDFIDTHNISNVENIVNSLPELFRHATKEINENYKTNELIQFFISCHLEDLDEDCLKETFLVDNVKKITQEMFIEELSLKAVVIYASPEGLAICMDFMLDYEYSDQILALNFTEEGTFTGFSHES